MLILTFASSFFAFAALVHTDGSAQNDLTSPNDSESKVNIGETWAPIVGLFMCALDIVQMAYMAGGFGKVAKLSDLHKAEIYSLAVAIGSGYQLHWNLISYLLTSKFWICS